MKQKKCKFCKLEFTPIKPRQSVCGFDCAIAQAKVNTAKDARKVAHTQARELRAAKIAIKPLKYWEDKAQAAMNRWIVHGRDRDLPCISCGTTNPNVQYCASHYRTRKAANQLRFNEDNLHKACNHYCNMQLSGNISAYRPALISKIGQERHDDLINNHETKRWTIQECQEIEVYYKNELKKLVN